MLFLGHFHPLLVHLPIGGLVLLGLLELLSRFTRWKDAAQNSTRILTFVSATAVVSAVCGWMLASGGGYDADLLSWHRVLGFVLAVVCLLCLLLRLRDWGRSYRVSLLAAVLLLAVTGHLGGTLTHGRGFATRDAPALLKPVAGYAMTRDGGQVLEPIKQQPVFAGIVQPILEQRCVSCHNAEKHKAELRLDNFAELLKGGQDGQVVNFGRARDSSLVQRMLLPPDADGHMPPEGQSQPTAEEIALLEWWINAGAPADAKVGDFRFAPEIARVLSAVRGRTQPTKADSLEK